MLKLHTIFKEHNYRFSLKRNNDIIWIEIKINLYLLEAYLSDHFIHKIQMGSRLERNGLIYVSMILIG